MGKFIQNSYRFIALILIFAVSSVGAESTADDAYLSQPPPVKKSTWKASAFAGCALLAVVGGIFAICWSGGGNTPKHHGHCHGNHRGCPNTVTADCMSGACIYHDTNQEHGCCKDGDRERCCTDGGWNGQQQVINGPPPCCSTNGGVPPF